MTAFDTLAPTYDNDFTHTSLGRILRHKAQERLKPFLSPGMRILELGCGTGEDARWIGEQGLSIVSTDASPVMREQAQSKTMNLPSVTIEPLDMTQPPQEWPQTPFDVVFSHFGALNCVPDMKPLVSWLTPRVKTGGYVILMVMSPYCLWEQVFYLLRGKPHMAFRRRYATTFQPAPDQPPLTIQYPSIPALSEAFSPAFRTLAVQPMGLFIPPSELFGMVEKRPWLKRGLLALESRFGDRQAFASFADHYTLVLQKL